jgi:hypothetical protein
MAAIKAVVTAGIKSEVEFRANSQIALSLLAIGRERAAGVDPPGFGGVNSVGR